MEIRLLGPVEFWVAGQPVNIGGPRQRTVLAALGIDVGRPVPVSTLVDRIWGDAPPDRARHALHVYIARIRKMVDLAAVREATPARLARRGGGYILELAADQVDTQRFHRLIQQARKCDRDASGTGERADLLQTALALWRGTPLADLPGDWAAQIREALIQQRLDALTAWAHAELQRGNPAAVIGALNGVCGDYPLAESLTAALMRALYLAGRNAEALQCYATTRTRLAEQLGTDPGRDLQELHQAILRGQTPPHPLTIKTPHPPTTAAPNLPHRPTRLVPAQLPPDIYGFAGRRAELDHLDTLANAGHTQPTAVIISAVVGTAGIGKTSLAVHWAHQLTDRYPDGALYVNLRGFDPSGPATRPDEALRGFLEALGTPTAQIPTTLTARTGLYRSLLDGRRMLVLLDNARDAGQVRPLLPGSPGCLTVVTSRNQLSSLVTTQGAQPITLGLLTTDEARQLLARRLGPARLAAEPEAVQAIITRCAGLPLALALVAARASARTRIPLAHIAAELGRASRPLDAFSSDDAMTDTRAVFSWSYQGLSPQAAELFRALGLHPGPAISTLAATSLLGVHPADAQTRLSELERVNLVTLAAPDRYTTHDLLWAYARELAHTTNPAEENDRSVSRMLDHYLHAAHHCDLLLDPHRDPITPPPRLPGVQPVAMHSHEQALAWYVAEHATLVGVFDLAATNRRHEYLWQMAWILGNYLERQGHWKLWTHTLYAGKRAAEQLGDKTAQGRCLRALARAHARLNDPDRATAHLHQALELYAALGDQVGQAYVHLNFNVILVEQERYTEAVPHCTDALQLFRHAQHQTGQALALNAIGWCHAHLGQIKPALDHCHQALDLHRHIGNRAGEADTWDSLGHAHHADGNLTSATTAYHKALNLFTELGDRYNQALAHLCLGDIAQQQDQPTKARPHWTSALHILHEINHPAVTTAMDRLSNNLPSTF